MAKSILNFFAVLLLAFYSIKSHSDASQDNAVHIAVASNFASTLEDLAEEFTDESGYSVIISSAATGQLYTQIIQKAPYDIFLSADAERPALLEEKKLIIKNSRFTYAIGQLALYAPQSKTIIDENWITKNTPEKLAIANPKIAPYGLAAMQYLQAINRWDALQSKLAYGQTITQAFQYVASGNADAGLVALSSLKQSGIDKSSYFIIPVDMHQPLHQDAVLLNNESSAKQFMEFIKSPKARTIIINAGYRLE